MSEAFSSTTRQPQSPHAWTFSGLELDGAGSVIAAERNGLRGIKAKGLVVRYANPFTSPGVKPEILCESSDSFVGLHRTPEGALHVRGKNKHHFEVKGKWKSKVVGEGVLTAIHAYGPQLLLTTGWPEQCFRSCDDGSYALLETLPGKCLQIAGDETTGLYAATDDGISYFDGQRWAELPNTPRNGRVLVLSATEILATGALPTSAPEDATLGALYRGNAKDGFSLVVPDGGHQASSGTLVRVTKALGEIFLTQTHGYGRGAYRVEGSAFTPVMQASGTCDATAGDENVLWHANGVELLCFNGKEWRSVERAHHDTTKW